MTDPHSLYTFSPEDWASVQGTEPVMMHLLEGYVDAGGVTRNLAEQIIRYLYPFKCGVETG